MYSSMYFVQRGPYRQNWPTHSHHELISVHAGNAVIKVGKAEVRTAAGVNILVKPRLAHRTMIDPGCWLKGVNLYFDAGSFADQLDCIAEIEPAPRSSPTASRIASLFVDILKENQNLERGAQNCADAYLQLLLVEILRSQGGTLEEQNGPATASDTSVQARIDQCMHYIESHYHEDLTLERLARELCVSPWHLSHTFSQQASTTVSAYITEVRMRRAEGLVTQTRRPLKEIASAVGYADEYYFSKVFRRHHGIPPGAYRKAQTGR